MTAIPYFDGDRAFIPLRQHGYTVVGVDDVPEVLKSEWSVVGGCARNSKMIRLHRQLMSAAAGTQIDRINQDKLDNRRSNLRIATHGQNMQNRVTWGKSGYLGVFRRKDRDKWTAQISCDNRRHTLGYFDTAEDAARAYNRAAVSLHGPNARQNILKGES